MPFATLLPAAIRFIALIAAYVLCTWFSDEFILAPGQVTLFWPAAGVAYAAAVRYGWRWAIVVPVAVVVAHSAVAPVPLAFLPFSVLSNYAGALVAARMVGHADPLRVTLAGGFALLRAAVAMTVVSALLGVPGLIVAGLVPWSAFAAAGLKWALGDLLGIVCVAPSMLLLLAPGRGRRALADPGVGRGETIAWALVLFGTFAAIYWAGQHHGVYALATVALPLAVLVWSAMRLPPLATALGTAGSIMFMTSLTGLGLAGFTAPTTLLDTTMLLGFLILFASVPLMLAAAVNEQRLAARRELRAAAKRAEAQREELERLVAERTRELHEVNQRLQLASQTDPLTGLRNRRYLSNQLPADLAYYDREQDRSHDDEQPVVLALVDIDHFKRINDTWGHKAGDTVLQQFAERLTRLVRTGDYVVRWGGEEFLLVFRPMPRTAVPMLAERIRACVRDTPFVIEGAAPLALTCSTGLSEYPWLRRDGPSLRWEQMVELADIALYWVKQHGRDGWAMLRPTAGASEQALTDLSERLHQGADALLADGALTMVASRQPDAAA